MGDRRPLLRELREKEKSYRKAILKSDRALLRCYISRCVEKRTHRARGRDAGKASACP